MSDPFPIIDVPAVDRDAIEPMGSRDKFWFDHPDLGRCLFKFARPDSGEDWSEKIASELAELLGLPHAIVELAECDGKRGIVSPSFRSADDELLHGNEILFEQDPTYPRAQPDAPAFRRVPKHTVDRVVRVNSSNRLSLPLGMEPPSSSFSAADVFVGYLTLDAWIGNTDRHHENWGWVRLSKEPHQPANEHLAPTYDHASSLGAHETDEARDKRLTTKDRGYSVEKYVEKCVSALYDYETDAKPATTMQAFLRAARQRPRGAEFWLSRLEAITSDNVESILLRIPHDRMSTPQREFAKRMLELNRLRLLKARKSLE